MTLWLYATMLKNLLPTDIHFRTKPAFAALLEAIECATDTQSQPWDFAVSIKTLRNHGCSDNDMRWLVKKGYARHAREVTVCGDDGRAFRSAGNLTFSCRSCFVLTEAGIERAHEIFQNTSSTHALNGKCDNSPPVDVPEVHWDSDARKLRVNGTLVKRFRWPAVNQEAILNAFQEEDWPQRIDDPLPPQAEQDPKRRLSDTIKCLNRKHSNKLIRFCGDGTGEGILWEMIKPGVNGHSLS